MAYSSFGVCTPLTYMSGEQKRTTAPIVVDFAQDKSKRGSTLVGQRSEQKGKSFEFVQFGHPMSSSAS